MTLAEDLMRGPKLLANPEAVRAAKARDMYRRGYSRKAIAHELNARSQTVGDWLRHVKTKPY